MTVILGSWVIQIDHVSQNDGKLFHLKNSQCFIIESVSKSIRTSPSDLPFSLLKESMQLILNTHNILKYFGS